MFLSVGLVPFKTCQELFFQPSPALFQSSNLDLEIIEHPDDRAVLVAQRVKTAASRYHLAYRPVILREACQH